MTLTSPRPALNPTKTVLPPSDRANCAVMNTAPTNWAGKREASGPLASRGLPTGPTVSACLRLRDPQTRIALATAHSSSTTPPLPTGTGDRDHDGLYGPRVQVGAQCLREPSGGAQDEHHHSVIIGAVPPRSAPASISFVPRLLRGDSPPAGTAAPS